MATTTNYGWVTPDDTDLVKDGAAAIRTLGSSADTTTKNLNPETTLGDLSFRSSTSDVNTRIGIGTAGQNLTVVAGVPAWATPSSGGMTLLSTTTLSGASTTISGIDGSFVNLVAFVFGVTNATGNGEFRLAVNGSTNGQIYRSSAFDNNSGVTDVGEASTFFKIYGTSPLRTDANNFAQIIFFDYASTSHNKVISAFGRVVIPTISRIANTFGVYNADTAITSLVFTNSAGNLSTGTVLLYGVK